MEYVLGIGAAGTSVALVIAVIIAFRFARSRSEKGDQANDRWAAKVVELETEKTSHRSTQHALAVATDNNAKQAAMLETQKAELARVAAAIKTTEEQLHDLVAKSVTNAPVAVIAAAAVREAGELRALVERLRAKAEAVPGLPGPDAAAAGGEGGGEDGGLPDAAHR